MNYRKPTKFYNWWKILPLYIIKVIFRTAAITFLPIYCLSIHLRFIKTGQFHRTPEIQFMCRQRRFILCNMCFPFLSRATHAHRGSPELSPCSVTWQWHCASRSDSFQHDSQPRQGACGATAKLLGDQHRVVHVVSSSRRWFSPSQTPLVFLGRAE